MDILDFFEEDGHQYKENFMSTVFSWMWSGILSHVHFSRSARGISRLCVEYRQVEIVQNKSLVNWIPAV